MSQELNACPSCGKRGGEILKSELASRFPYTAKCARCGFMTEPVRFPGIAVKLWNEAKVAGKKTAKS